MLDASLFVHGVVTDALMQARRDSTLEVLAGVLRDCGRSLLLREWTCGKGSVQAASPWRRSRAVLERYTASR